jgi:Protein kinase domain/SnoaL-like domain
VSDLVLESTFAGCRIERVAGRGGMGVVYLATQLPLGRAVALKVMAPERAADSTFHARFEQESRLAAAIDHPNVIPVYDAGEEDGRLYLVMRWVKGTDLQALIAGAGALDPARAAAIVGQLGAGLDAAHAAGLIHRDVKPANVLIAGEDGSGHVYLTDFGLTLDVAADARITDSGEWVGTLDFMAPEQFEGGHVDARTDVYALGCVLYAALTGRAPFPRRTVAQTMLAHLGEPPPRPSASAGVPPAFDAVVARALAKDPGERYPSAGELATAALSASGSPAVHRPAAPARLAANGGAAAATAILPHSVGREPEPPPEATARITRAPRRLPARVLLTAGAVLVVAASAGAVLGAGPFAADEPSGPLTEAEVNDAVSAFAGAYTREDDDALAGVLTPDVARVTPGDRQRGRAAVLREYRRQFAANPTRDYSLDELVVRPGAAGRASGRYVVARAGRAPIAGRIALGVRRDEGRPKVGLIAVTPER